MKIWIQVIVWIFWLALVLWWVNPGVSSIKEHVNENNAQIERLQNE